MSISLISELVFTKPKLTPMGNCNGHESQRLTVYREFGVKELYGRSIKKNALFNSRKPSITNLWRHNCPTQGFRGCQINKGTEIFCDRSFMTWPSMTININMEVLAIRHCFKPKQPYPISMLTELFWKTLTFQNIAISLQILRVKQNFTIKYKTSWNFSSENLKPKFQADQKLTSSQRGMAFFGTPDIVTHCQNLRTSYYYTSILIRHQSFN